MKPTSLDWKSMLRWTIIWALLNVIFNFAGLLITRTALGDAYPHFQSFFRDFTRPLLYQSGAVLLVTVAVNAFLKNFRLRNYLFPLLQFVLLNAFFLMGLKSFGGWHFETAFDAFGLKYMSTFGQYLVDVFYLIDPMPGLYENDTFIPSSTGMFYLHWVVLTSAYYFLLSALTETIDKRLGKKKTTV